MEVSKMLNKRIPCTDRMRIVPKQFSWIDHALVRKKYICGLSCESLSLYLFLLTVGDAEGVSYYSDKAIICYLELDYVALKRVRLELCQSGLIAYSSPFYQVLSLNNISGDLTPAPCEEKRSSSQRSSVNSDAIPISQILDKYIGGTQ